MTSDTNNSWEKERKSLLKEFDDLLDSIDSSTLKEKILWRQIYKNSISDRNSAYMCFIDLYPHVKSDSDNHTMFGDKLSKYLERMEKSNEQLLKLGNLIRKAIESTQVDDGINEDELLSGSPIPRLVKDEDK